MGLDMDVDQTGHEVNLLDAIGDDLGRAWRGAPSRRPASRTGTRTCSSPAKRIIIDVITRNEAQYLRLRCPAPGFTLEIPD